MQGEFIVKLVSPQKPYYQGKSQRVSLPTKIGYLDLGAGHTPLVAQIGVGLVCVRIDAENQKKYFISGGTVKVQGDTVVVLAKLLEEAGEIDRERAKSSKERAYKRLQQKDHKIDTERALRSQKRAEERILSSEGS